MISIRRHRSTAIAVLFFVFATTGCSLLPWRWGKHTEKGNACWYGGAQYEGRRTASGERYDSDALTAAHRSLPFGTIVRVKNLHNGREVGVRINDRGPFKRGRIIDVSHEAARRLGMLGEGVVPVRIEVVRMGPR